MIIHNNANSLIINLINTGRKDPYVLAVLLTESYFRNSFHRTLEYIMWILLYKLSPSRVLRLSVGIAQAQVRHWVNLKLINSAQPCFSSIKKVINPYINYDLCSIYLGDLISQGVALEEIALVYRGRVGRYYYEVLYSSLNYINKLLEARRFA